MKLKDAPHHSNPGHFAQALAASLPVVLLPNNEPTRVALAGSVDVRVTSPSAIAVSAPPEAIQALVGKPEPETVSPVENGEAAAED